jgi:hypothetical protein
MSQAMSMPMQMVGQLSQFGQMAGQLPQMLGQAPQLLSQAVQLPMGMLGQLGNVGNRGAAGAPVDAASTATLSQAAMSTGGAGLGGGGGVGSGGSGVVPSSFTRPASSFATPSAPKLPGGFTGLNAAPEPVAGSASSGMGGGGLYGAPAAMGREGTGSSSEKTPTRTMQLTARRRWAGGIGSEISALAALRVPINSRSSTKTTRGERLPHGRQCSWQARGADGGQ